jgi:hypothetical protein
LVSYQNEMPQGNAFLFRAGLRLRTQYFG